MLFYINRLDISPCIGCKEWFLLLQFIIKATIICIVSNKQPVASFYKPKICNTIFYSLKNIWTKLFVTADIIRLFFEKWLLHCWNNMIFATKATMEEGPIVIQNTRSYCRTINNQFWFLQERFWIFAQFWKTIYKWCYLISTLLLLVKTHWHMFLWT